MGAYERIGARVYGRTCMHRRVCGHGYGYTGMCADAADVQAVAKFQALKFVDFLESFELLGRRLFSYALS